MFERSQCEKMFTPPMGVENHLARLQVRMGQGIGACKKSATAEWNRNFSRAERVHEKKGHPDFDKHPRLLENWLNKMGIGWYVTETGSCGREQWLEVMRDMFSYDGWVPEPESQATPEATNKKGRVKRERSESSLEDCPPLPKKVKQEMSVKQEMGVKEETSVEQEECEVGKSVKQEDCEEGVKVKQEECEA